MKIKLSGIRSTYNPVYRSTSGAQLVQKVELQLAELLKKAELLRKLQRDLERKVKFDHIMGTKLVASYVKSQQEADGNSTTEEMYIFDIECDTCSFMTALCFEGNRGFEEVHYRIHIPSMDYDLDEAVKREIKQLTDIDDFSSPHDPRIFIH